MEDRNRKGGGAEDNNTGRRWARGARLQPDLSLGTPNNGSRRWACTQALDPGWTGGVLMRLGVRRLHFSSLTLRWAVLRPGPWPVNQTPALLCINTFHSQSAKEAGAGDLVTVSWTI